MELKNLGTANGWGSKKPEIVEICRILEHETIDTPDHTYGHDHTVVCAKCGYFYKYCSS